MMTKREVQVLLVLRAYYPGSLNGLHIHRALRWSFWHMPPYAELFALQQRGLVRLDGAILHDHEPKYWEITDEGTRTLARYLYERAQDV